MKVYFLYKLQFELAVSTKLLLPIEMGNGSQIRTVILRETFRGKISGKIFYRN